MIKNRLWNVGNPYQGDRKRVLCVCSAGLLRSPTAAVVLATKYNRNTRAVGIDVGHALIPIDQVLLSWAEEIVCMNTEQMHRLFQLGDDWQIAMPEIVCLDIPDNYNYMDETLVSLIDKRYGQSLENTSGAEDISSGNSGA